ncbi:unnamed protein product [Mesocestoides corti]|uniref:Na_H_Exchanger domain-containing protein n=1 Tax=Mesocestoides corti TaxID=53468 RepID=A0A0R3U3E1_MESCO|nr:unnamed protein product [Mesocestoides corti]
MASGIAAQVFAVFLGVLFIASGSVKTIKLNSSLYRELLKAFINLTNASPIRLLGLKTSPLVYMQTSGVIELICGTTLATGTLRSQSVACIGLMSLMFLTSYCHMVLGDVGSVSFYDKLILNRLLSPLDTWFFYIGCTLRSKVDSLNLIHCSLLFFNFAPI